MFYSRVKRQVRRMGSKIPKGRRFGEAASKASGKGKKMMAEMINEVRSD